MCRNAVHVLFVGCILCGCLVSVCPQSYALGKEPTTLGDSDEAEVTVRGQYIYVTTTRAMTIRLYSILGQLVTQQSVQGGTTRIKAPARGVYILKAGSVTRRVTINS